MAADRRVVFLGMCSGDRDLIAQWTASGDMPNVRRLMETGLTGTQRGLPGVYVGAHWPSLISGCHPGRNRVHSWQQLQPGSYAQYRCNAGDHSQRRPFWEALSDAGRRLCILDVPHSRISKGLNGIQTVEWGAHDAAYGFMASSPDLEADILGRFGRHPVSGNSDRDRDPGELLEFEQELLRGIRMKRDVTRALYARERWDFFAQVFTEAHCAGHLLWHLHDPAYHWNRGGNADPSCDPIKQVYVAIDEAVGAVLDDVGDDATVVFLANHGMGPKGHAHHLLEPILIGLGYAAPAVDPEPAPADGWRQRLDPTLTWGWQRLPQSLRSRLVPLRDAKRRVMNPERSPPPLIDPGAGKVFTVVNNTAHGAIRVNLRGREPAGVVEPGPEYERLLDDLSRDLLDLVNLDTGGKVVAQVYRCDDLYPGPERAHLPDLFVQWQHGTEVTAVGSSRLPRVEGEYRYVRSGEHRPDSMFVIRGPGIETARLPDPVSCVDWAPTLCALLGVEPDGDLDGRPIEAVLRAAAHAPAF